MKRIIVLLLSVAATIVASAQAVPSLLIPSDPVALSMTGVSVSGGADAYAVENNSALMAFSEKKMEAAVGYMTWAPSTAASTALSMGGYYALNEKLAFGLSGKLFKDKALEGVTTSGTAKGTYNPQDMVVSLGVSYLAMQGLSAGLSLKYISSSLGGGMSGTAFAADLGVAYSKDALSAGVSIANIGTPISYGGGSYPLPMLVRAGGSYALNLGESSTLGLSAEADYIFSGGIMAGAGAEFAFNDTAFVRAGIHYGNEEKAVPTFAALGLGVKFMGIKLDVAYLLANASIGSTLALGLGYSF